MNFVEIREIRFVLNSSISLHGQTYRAVSGAFKMERESSALVQYAPVSKSVNLETKDIEWFDYYGRLLQFDRWSEFFGAVEISPADVSWETVPPTSTWRLYLDTSGGSCCLQGHDSVLPDLVEQLHSLLTESDEDDEDKALIPRERCRGFGSRGSRGSLCSGCKSTSVDLYQRCASETERKRGLKFVRTPVYRCRCCQCITTYLDRLGGCAECHSSNVKTLKGRDWEIGIEESDLEFMLEDSTIGKAERDYIQKVYNWKRSGV